MSDSTTDGYVPPPTPIYDQTSTGQPFAGSDDGSGKADAARREASSVASDAADAGQHVASVAKDETAGVASEAVSQARGLVDQATSELREQAGVQQQRAADGLRSISDELTSMADRSDGGGVATELVRNLSGRAGSVASWLDGRDPGSLVDEVKSFAARKPGTFIAIAAGAGILAGRLTKALTAEAKSGGATTGTPDASRPAPAAATPPITTPATPVGTTENEHVFDGDEYTRSSVGTPTFDELIDEPLTTDGRYGEDGPR